MPLFFHQRWPAPPYNPLLPEQVDPDITKDEFWTLLDETGRGLASGYPPCCVRAFVNTRSRWFTDLFRPRTRRALIQAVIRIDSEPLPCGWGYVPCSRCRRTGNQVATITHV